METLKSDLNFENFDGARPESSELKPPFPYLEMNWHNGFAAASGGAMKFGGWQIGEENAQRAISLFGKLPGYFGEKEMWAKGKGDGEYPAHSSRFITATAFATRVKWYDGRNGEKGSSKTQVLVYLCEIDKNHNITPYGPALISGGSYHAGVAVSAAFSAWATHISANRDEAGLGNIPAWAFYGYFGTFGDKRITKEVGKSEKNFIVPCQVNFPKEVTALRGLYVGDTVAAEIMTLRKQAQAWLDDAKPRKIQQSEPAMPEFEDPGF